MTIPRLAIAAALLAAASVGHGEIVEYVGSATPVPHAPYVRVVSEAVAPVQPTYVKTRDGVYVATAIRKPAGAGPFPALIVFHGAPGGRGMEQLIGWSRGDPGGPLWERFLAEGYVVVVADYRGGPWNTVNAPSDSGLVTAIDDGLSIIDRVRALPYVDAARISLYGVSLGGNLVLFLAAAAPDVHAVVAGAPAPIWFLGATVPTDGTRPDFAAIRPDPAVAADNIGGLAAPVLIQVGTVDPLLPLCRLLHDQLTTHGKTVRMEIYQHGYHDFVLGPQGQARPDLEGGEVLLQGALDALDRAVAFIGAAPR